MADSMLDLFILFLCTLVLQRAFHEWLKFEHPIMKRTIWWVLVPSYVFISISTTLSFFMPTQTLFLSMLQSASTVIFIDTSLLFAVFLFMQQLAKRTV